MIKIDGCRIVRTYDHETLWIEPWGPNSLRVRATRESCMPDVFGALDTCEHTECELKQTDDGIQISNGKICARIEANGKISLYNQNDELLLEEYYRDMNQKDFSSHMRISAREFKGIPGGAWQITQRFESDPNEKLYGMGQYQQGMLNLKGTTLELQQRNSQVTVPFVLSSKGYGMLWNNPSVGEVNFATNITQWKAQTSRIIDYMIIAGDTPSEICSAYVKATGLPPMMPDSAMGYWQCKLRYRSQKELLEVAREYKKRGIPLSVIVIDFFHWTKHGEWKFNPVDWPDPEAMVDELKEMGVDVSVSVWPTVQMDSENYTEMLEKGYLVQTDNGVRLSINSKVWTIFLDATNPEAREYLWKKCKRNYYDIGIKYFWLDVAEPQYSSANNYGADAYRYSIGPQTMYGNAYPVYYTKAFYDGLTQEGETQPLSLVRSAWAGSQKYGALVWSGDIHSSFKSMRWQLCAGLNAGLSGISWWTTDIGGFDWGNINDEEFRELLVRWFEWGTFCPVMRMHGDRQPHVSVTESGTTDYVGADNEVWSFGQENYPILVKYIKLREAMRPYIKKLMYHAHTEGEAVMRPLFWDFPNDPEAWNISDSYMFGPDVLVSPVMEKGITMKQVYLPEGSDWIEAATNNEFAGGKTVSAYAPRDVIPVFVRKGAKVDGLII